MKQSLESRDRIFFFKTLINNDKIYAIKSFFLYLFFFIFDWFETFIDWFENLLIDFKLFSIGF